MASHLERKQSTPVGKSVLFIRDVWKRDIAETVDEKKNKVDVLQKSVHGSTPVKHEDETTLGIISAKLNSPRSG